MYEDVETASAARIAEVAHDGAQVTMFGCGESGVKWDIEA
jgi:hypothetical protein